MTKTIQIPKDWEKIEHNLYKFKDVLIDTNIFEDGGIPYEVKNPQLKQNQNSRFWSYKWQDILDFVYGDDEKRTEMKRNLYKYKYA